MSENIRYIKQSIVSRFHKAVWVLWLLEGDNIVLQIYSTSFFLHATREKMKQHSF